MIIVSGKAKFPPGAFEKISDGMAAMVKASRAEKGCIDYSYGVDTMEPDTLVVVEYWEDWASLEAHFAEPHMAEWRKTLGEIGVISRDIKASETGETKQL